MTRTRVYDLLLICFILALLWAALSKGFVTSIANHASNFGAVGLVSLLLIRPRRFGSASATGRVVTTAGLVALAAGLVELLVGTTTYARSSGLSLTTTTFVNTKDVWDAAAGLLAAVLIVLVHVLLSRRDVVESPEPSPAPR